MPNPIDVDPKWGKEIYMAMNLVMKDLEAIKKENRVAAGSGGPNYAFRGIDQFLNAVHPLIAKYRIIIEPEALERHQEFVKVEGKYGVRIDKHVAVKISFKFRAVDGSYTETVMWGEGVDGGDKATAKANSAALKYALIQTFFVPTEDIEDSEKSPTPQEKEDNDPRPAPTAEQVKGLAAQSAEKNETLEKIRKTLAWLMHGFTQEEKVNYMTAKLGTKNGFRDIEAKNVDQLKTVLMRLDDLVKTDGQRGKNATNPNPT